MLLLLSLLSAACIQDKAGDDDHEGDDAGECADGADNDRDGLFDCDDDGCAGASDCASASYDPSAPSAPGVSVTPAAPKDYEDLLCEVSEPSEDPEGDAVSYSFRWLVDGANAGVTDAAVDAALTSPGEVWGCEVTPFDGVHEGPPGLAEVTIEAVESYDVLLLLDASASMADEAAALIENLDTLLAPLADRGARVALATVDVEGRAGALLGGAVAASDAETITERIACQASCWDEEELPSDPSYSCGDPIDTVSQEVLDCVCGRDGWQDGCGGGNEEHLEALWMVLCRATGGAHEQCTDSLSALSASDLPDGDAEGWLSGDAPVLALVFSDEGDSSRRLAAGETDISTYTELYEALGVELWFAGLGPEIDENTGGITCNSGGAQIWAVERLSSLAEATGYSLYPLEQEVGGDCEATVVESLEALAADLSAR